MKYLSEFYQTDVVIIGGGLAGSIAALQARKADAEVIVIESANTYRSGNAGVGIDHLFSYVPPVHEKAGYSRDDMKQILYRSAPLKMGIAYKEFTDFFVDHSYERILELENYGLKLRFEEHDLSDGFRLIPQFHPVPSTINFEGRNIKVKLTEAMLDAGVTILNHSSVVEILTDESGAASGVIAISSKEDKLITVAAKTTIIATTSGAGRLGENTNTTHNHFEWPSRTHSGFGISLPMKAGAEVTNLEFSFLNGGLSFAGFNFTAAAPGGSWWPAGRVVDDYDNVVVDRVINYKLDEPDYIQKNFDQFERFMHQKNHMTQLMLEGRQLYVDLHDASEAEIEYIKWSISHEGRGWLFLKNAEHEHMDFRKAKIPFRLNHNVRFKSQSTGVLADLTCESTVKNLFAAGDIMGATATSSAPAAVVFGYEAGMQAALRAKKVQNYPKINSEQLSTILEKVIQIRTNSSGERWDNILRGLQNITSLFGVFPLTDTKIEHALSLIHSLKSKASFSAADAHETVRCFEVISLLDSAEAIFTAARLRKNSLGSFKRDSSDAPESLPTETEIYGLFFGHDGNIHYNTHIPRNGLAKEK